MSRINRQAVALAILEQGDIRRCMRKEDAKVYFVDFAGKHYVIVQDKKGLTAKENKV